MPHCTTDSIQNIKEFVKFFFVSFMYEKSIDNKIFVIDNVFIREYNYKKRKDIK